MRSLTGFKTIVLGLCLLIFELLMLPVFGTLQRLQVSGDGFYTDFMQYIGTQPYPIILFLTAIIILLGIGLMIVGFREEKHQ